MSNKLILVLLTLLISIIFIKTKTPANPPPLVTLTFTPTPAIPAHALLTFTPDTIYTNNGQADIVDININSQGKYPTLVQLELSYDPEIITQISLIPGSFFSNPDIMLNNKSDKTGRISYALSSLPGKKSLLYSGQVAKLIFTVNENSTKKSTTIYFLPKTSILSYDANISLTLGNELKIFINPSTSSASLSPINDVYASN